MRADLIFTLRTLRRNPLFTIFAMLSLALGIGATTAIFSLMDQVLLRSLPVRDPASIVLLHREYQPSGHSSSDDFESVFSYPMYRALRDQDPAFSGLVARASARVALSHQGSAEAASVELVSGNFFDTLGVRASAGRLLTPADDNLSANAVAVLNHSYWLSRFGGDRSVVNQTVGINGHPVLVAGVAGPEFNGLRPGSTPDLYVPISMQKMVMPTEDILNDHRSYWLDVFGRLKPGMALAQAQAATDVAYRAALEAELPVMFRNAPSARERDRFLNHKLEIRPAAQGINGLRRQWEKPLVAVMAMVALLLLITCANVAGLLLARAAGRQREIAIRLALGAGRGRLIRQLVVEGVALFLIASVLGLILAVWGASALIHVLPSDAAGNWLRATVNLRLLAFNTGLATIAGILFGLIPALQATHPDVASTLKDKAAQASFGGAARIRKWMVTAQVAFSLTLLVVAGLFSESLFHLMEVNLGFHAERLLTISVDATPSRPDAPGAYAFYRELQARLSSMPGVRGAAAGGSGPFSDSDQSGNISVDGYRARDDENMNVEFSPISPRFFEALGIPVRTGREFTDRDQAGAPKVVVVNDAFAKRFFGSQNPTGRRIMIGASNHPVYDHEIVGVAADMHKEVAAVPKPTLFFPYSQEERPARLFFYIRTAGEESQLGPSVRTLIRSIDPNVAVGNPEPMTLLVRNSIYTERLMAALSVAFGVLATLMAAIGLYGVVGYAVTRRTSEIGLRMALGALPGEVVRMVLGEAAVMVGVGIVLGIAGGVGLGKFAQSQLFGIQAADPLLVVTGVGVITLVTVAAASIPAWRASRIDPVSALKYE